MRYEIGKSIAADIDPRLRKGLYNEAFDNLEAVLTWLVMSRFSIFGATILFSRIHCRAFDAFYSLVDRLEQ